MAADEVGEFERIRRFFAPLAGPGGLGLTDDAALVDCAPGHRLVVTADAIVAGVHYLPEDPPDLVARKLLRVNLSDLAAMGARPLHYALTTALPPELGPDWLARFANGLAEDQRRYGIDLLGGDSVGTRGPAVLSLTAIGKVAEGREIRRCGAKPGDVVWVSGTIGDAFFGLAVLRGAYPDLAAKDRDQLVRHFQLPDPRTELGPRLCGIASAMIDVSDGLLADLGHICETSKVSALVEMGRLPLSPSARSAIGSRLDILPQLAASGDDYELLFTAPVDATDAIIALSSAVDVPVTRIGSIYVGTGVRLVDADGLPVPVKAMGYRHF
ncbi:MAG: thiamine-phosphate kinase [Alphaproteobacteria bacterium]|nr:thiamine-phosphate kinase [Alphaproteobacteria bacterium]